MSDFFTEVVLPVVGAMAICYLIFSSDDKKEIKPSFTKDSIEIVAKNVLNEFGIHYEKVTCNVPTTTDNTFCYYHAGNVDSIKKITCHSDGTCDF